MKFLKKPWVAVTLCVLMVVSSLVIASRRNERAEYHPESISNAENWGEENYESYTQFIYDEEDILSNSTIRELSSTNAALDYRYGSICAVAILDGLDGMDMEDTAYEYSERLSLGDADALLLVDTEAEDWYFVYGTDFSYYVNNELEVLFREMMVKAVREPDMVLPAVFTELSQWYADHVPVADQQTESNGSGVFVVLLFLVILALVVAASSVRPYRRRFFGWGPTIILGGHRPPRPGPGPTNFHSPGGRPGGFGGSSRGSGFRGGGGFGGSSRGGGFGGRR